MKINRLVHKMVAWGSISCLFCFHGVSKMGVTAPPLDEIGRYTPPNLGQAWLGGFRTAAYDGLLGTVGAQRLVSTHIGLA